MSKEQDNGPKAVDYALDAHLFLFLGPQRGEIRHGRGAPNT